MIWLMAVIKRANDQVIFYLLQLHLLNVGLVYLLRFLLLLLDCPEACASDRACGPTTTSVTIPES